MVCRLLFRVVKLLFRPFALRRACVESLVRIVAFVIRTGGDEACFGFRSFLDPFLLDLW